MYNKTSCKVEAFLVFAKKRNTDGPMVHAKIYIFFQYKAKYVSFFKVKDEHQEIRQGNCDGLVGWCGKKVAI